MRHLKRSLIVVLVLFAVGCESDGRKPMDEKLSDFDAYDMDTRLRDDADALLRERADDEPLPPRFD